MTFEVYRDRIGRYRWRLVARNRRVLADSGQSYASATGAVQAARTVRIRMADATVRDEGSGSRGWAFKIFPDQGGHYRWHLVAPNSRVVADGGQGFSSRASVLRSITVIRGAGTAPVVRPGRGPDLPGDPVAAAPPLSQVQVTGLGAATSFLYEGDRPIQSGVAPGAVRLDRAAVVRGRVTGRDGAPVAGVRVSVLGKPELGQTSTRSDGMFDLAVNGGGPLTIDYDRSGFLPVQRRIDVPWLDFVWAPDVTLVEFDASPVRVRFGSSTMTVVQGEAVSDDVGDRRATLLIPSGTKATATLTDGTSIVLPVATVRAIEYTVGATADSAMPAELPPVSALTYAVDLNVEEGDRAGAIRVDFDRPVVCYVENFLHFPSGSVVPYGAYDRVAGSWLPEADGRVVTVTEVSGGRARLDVTGAGVESSSAELASLGITNEERDGLGGLYAAGESLWRTPMTHFSPADLNWPVTADGVFPKILDLLRSLLNMLLDDSCKVSGGSTIDSMNQILEEDVALAGTGAFLHYRSDMCPGRREAYRVDIPLTEATVPVDLMAVHLEIYVAGQRVERLLTDAPNQRTVFEWDGRDAYGRPIQGTQLLTVRLGYEFAAKYALPGSSGPGFAALAAGGLVTGDRARSGLTYWQEWNAPIGAFDAGGLGLGGWMLSTHHVYDPGGRVLYLGDGRRRGASSALLVITTLAGGVVGLGTGDGGPATEARLLSPRGVAVGPDGSIYVADEGDFRVRRIGPDSVISTIAGTGQLGSSGDGGPAVAAKIWPAGLAAGGDGSVYVADPFASRVRRIRPDGIIETFAGTGTAGFSGDGGPADQARLSFPTDVAVGPDGSVYIADTNNFRVRRVDGGGLITTVAGLGQSGTGPAAGEEGQALTVSVQPTSVAVARDGTLYVAEGGPGRIRRVGLDGRIRTIAGIGPPSAFGGDGGPATAARLSSPSGIALARDGSVFFNDGQNCRVRVISVGGVINTVAGTGEAGSLLEGGPAAAARLDNRPAAGMTVAPNGDVIFADVGNGAVRRLSSAMPGFALTDLAVPSDDGKELYRFTSNGRHLQTLDAVTGALLRRFDYDSAGRLSEMDEGAGNVTRIERSLDGAPIAVVAPWGQRTGLTVDASGRLTSVTAPTGETVGFSYTPEGLMIGATDPADNAAGYTYDEDGRLVGDQGPRGGTIALARAAITGGRQVVELSAELQERTYALRAEPDGGFRTEVSCCGGATTPEVVGRDGTRVLTRPDGSVVTSRSSPDPRWGMQAPLPAETTVALPGGRQWRRLEQKAVTLLDSANPLTVDHMLDRVTISGRPFERAFNATARTWTFRTPAGRESGSLLDDRWRVSELRIPGQSPIRCDYDNRDRVVAVAQGSGAGARTVNVSYGGAGLPESVMDPEGNTITVRYDASGRPIRTVLADDRILAFRYDLNGNLAGVTPPDRPVHTIEFDPGGLPVAYMPPAAGGVSTELRLEYDADGRPLRIRRQDGRVIDIAYDAAGRLATITTADGVRTFDYRPSTDQVESVAATGGPTLTYSYEGPLVTKQSSDGPAPGAVSQVYDDDFRAGTEVVDGNSINYVYDDDGLLLTAGELTIDRNVATGRPTHTLVGGVTETLQYDDFGDEIGRATTHGTTLLYSAKDTRDRLGRLIARTETTLGVPTTRLYTYDSTGRLASSTGPDGVQTDYGYDANDNRLTAGAIDGGYDERDRILRWGATTYTHTQNGEVQTATFNGDITTYEYDEFGALRAVELPSGRRIEYITDGWNRRSAVRVDGVLVRAFLYSDHLGPVAELDGAGTVVSRFVYGTDDAVPDYLVRHGATYRIVRDSLGSPRLVINATSGAVIQRLDYDVQGRVIANTNPGFQPFGFAGGLNDDDTGLVHFGAREYDPGTGRWTSPDPMLFASGDANLYVYAGNDPVNRADPTGLMVDAPGPWESLIPVWGSGKQSIHELQCGNLLRGLFYGALAISELLWIRAVVVGLARGTAWKFAGSHAFYGRGGVREWFAAGRGIAPGDAIDVHHWLVPHRAFHGTWAEVIFNQPWNLQPVDRFSHWALHNWSNVYYTARYGTPGWFKGLVLSAGGRVGMAIER